MRLRRLTVPSALLVLLLGVPVAAQAAPGQSEWNPPANLVTPLDEVWRHQEQTYGNLYGFRNYGWDQVFANGGSINYCVRWDSSAPVSAALRDHGRHGRWRRR